jgi:hypothetical protein
MAVRHDRVRAHTAAAVLERIDEATVAHLDRAARSDPAEIARRLDALDREWNVDRAIELEASTVGLVGVALGALARPGLLAVPAIVGAALFVHAAQGPYPLLPVFRRLGLRTSREIARERYALKALRGDFHAIGDTMPQNGVAAGDAPTPQADRDRGGTNRAVH